MSTMTQARVRPLTTGTLKNMLRDAVAEEDYKSAAVLRDELKEREVADVEAVRQRAGSCAVICNICGSKLCTGH